MGRVVRLLIREDDTATRVGLRLRIARERDVCIVGEANDGDAAARLAIELQPDVVLIDLDVVNRDALAWVAALRERAPECPCVGLTLHDSPANRLLAQDAGVAAVVSKRAPTEVLLNAIRQAARVRNRMKDPLRPIRE